MLCRFFGSSKNDPKSIAICLGVKISHLGIIKNQKKRKCTKKTRKTKTAPKLFAVFSALLDPMQQCYVYSLLALSEY